MGGRRLTDEQRGRIRALRYDDGLTRDEVAAIVGVHVRTVGEIAPGLPGKIENARLREAFLASGLTAAEVARRVGWWHTNGADASRVRRTLGVTPDINGRGGVRHRRRVDVDIAQQIADAIGVPRWEVGAE